MNCYFSSYPVTNLLCWAASPMQITTVVIGACSLSLCNTSQPRCITIMLSLVIWILQLNPLQHLMVRLSDYSVHVYLVSCPSSSSSGGWRKNELFGTWLRRGQMINACSRATWWFIFLKENICNLLRACLRNTQHTISQRREFLLTLLGHTGKYNNLM